MDNNYKNLMADQPICPVLEEHLSRPATEKARYLESFASKWLFKNLPADIGRKLREGFLEGVFRIDEMPVLQDVVDYFHKHSLIIPALHDNPGTYVMLEMEYGFEPVIQPIDPFFGIDPAGSALLFRYNIVNNYLAQYVVAVLEKQKNCLMVDIGSGPGRNGIDVSLRNPVFPDRLQVDCIEIDQIAINKGKQLIAKNRLTNINFVKKPMEKLNGYYNGNVDLGLNVGVVCGMPTKKRVGLLKAHHSWFKKGGKMFVAGLTDAMLEKALFCAYILLLTAGWRLQFRPAGELKQTAIEAGWSPVETFHDWPTCLYDIEVLEA